MSTPLGSRQSAWRSQVAVIAERGRQLLNSIPGRRSRTLPELCRELLEQRGEAGGLAVASEIVARLEQLDDREHERFLELLASSFGADPEPVAAAVERWRAAPSEPMRLIELARAAEAPRQELFRRINSAEQGTAALVRLRARLLRRLPEDAGLEPVESDLHHLLSSWFNRGFLRLEVIDWHSPAAILEKVIAYEAVHEIDGWEDLRRRLGADRRCFAFFHPALPEEPLIFVEVALTSSLSARIRPLIDAGRPTDDPRKASTAIFYSISSTQPGLRGVSFGNFLIKQVVGELQAELPGIRNFATLSPLPRLAASLRESDPAGFTDARLLALAGEEAAEVRLRTGEGELRAGLRKLLGPDLAERGPALERVAQRLVLAYLTQLRRGAGVLDPVANFHLMNGARLERINLDADPSEKGQRESFGAMVNYLYEPDRLELHHERYANHGEVTVARSLQSELARVRQAWEAG